MTGHLKLIALYMVGCVAFPNFASASVLVNLLGDKAFLAVAVQGEAGERWRQLPLPADNAVTLPARSVAPVKYAAPERAAP